MEIELGPDLHPIALPKKTDDDILLFLKLYNPEKEELNYVGRLLVKGSGKPVEILSKLNELAGYAPEDEIDLYEEINYVPTVMCEPIDKKSTFQASQLEDGDIICFQKSIPNEKQFRYPDVPYFLEFVQNRLRRDVYGAWEQYLGLEHSDNTPKRSYASNQNCHAYEKPIKIYN